MRNSEYSDSNDLALKELISMNTDGLLDYGSNIRKRYRDAGHLQASLRELEKVLSVLLERIEENELVSKAETAKLLFEKGYVAFLLGKTDESISLMKQQNEFCEVENDAVGVQIGLFRIAHAKLFGHQISPHEARDLLKSSLSEFADLKTKDIDVVRCENWIFNIQGRLFDLAIETSDAGDAEYFFKQFKESTQFSAELNPFIKNKNPITLRILHSREGRFSYIKGDYDRALSNFAIILNLDLSQWGEGNEQIVKNINTTQEAARDYYFCGKALKAKGLDKEANLSFQAGLGLDPQLANYYFQDLIRQEIKA